MTKFYSHPEYTINSPKWEFYRDLFEGEKQTLITPQYLIPHEFEKGERGTELRRIRERRTEYTNHIKPFIRRFVSLIFKKDHDFDLALEKILDEDEASDIDGNGTPLEDFCKRCVAEDYFLYGKAAIYIDSFSVVANSRGTELALGLRPFMECWKPLDLPDWQFSAGELDFATHKYSLTEPRQSAMQEPETIEYLRYVVLDNGVYKIQIYKKESSDYMLKEEITPQPALDFIPLSIVSAESWIKEAAPKAKQLYNLESVLDNIHLFQAHQRIIATGDFNSDGGSVAASEANLLMLKGQGSVQVVEPADTASLERRLEQVFLQMVKVVFNQQRHLPSDSGAGESWQTIREQKEEFRAIAINAAKDLQSLINNALWHFGKFKGKDIEQEEFFKLDTDITEEDVTEFMLWINAFRDRIDKYPTWRKAVDKKAAKTMNLLELPEILQEIDSLPVDTEQENDPIQSIFGKSKSGE